MDTAGYSVTPPCSQEKTYRPSSVRSLTPRALAMNPRHQAITKLAQLGWSQRQIARAVGLTQPGVLKVLRRCRRATPEDTPRGAHLESAPASDNSTATNRQTD